MRSKFLSLFSTAFFILKTSSGLLSASSKNVFVGESQTLSPVLHSNQSLISSSVFTWIVFSTAFASSPLLLFLFRLLFVGDSRGVLAIGSLILSSQEKVGMVLSSEFLSNSIWLLHVFVSRFAHKGHTYDSPALQLL